jgi:hypothetical protein
MKTAVKITQEDLQAMGGIANLKPLLGDSPPVKQKKNRR